MEKGSLPFIRNVKSHVCSNVAYFKSASVGMKEALGRGGAAAPKAAQRSVVPPGQTAEGIRSSSECRTAVLLITGRSGILLAMKRYIFMLAAIKCNERGTPPPCIKWFWFCGILLMEGQRLPFYLLILTLTFHLKLSMLSLPQICVNKFMFYEPSWRKIIAMP